MAIKDIVLAGTEPPFIVTRGLSMSAQGGMFSASVAAGADDARWDGSATFNATGTDVRFGFSDWVFVRFPGVTVPPGMHIDSATVTFIDTGSGFSGACGAFVRASAVDDGVMPTDTTTATTISGGPLTAASVPWVLPARVASATVVTPDSAAVVQEIVDRAGWAEGNAITFVFAPDDSVSIDFEMRRYAALEHLTLDPPRLDITYSPAGSGSIGWRHRRLHALMLFRITRKR